MSNPTNTISSVVETITPAMARVYLGLNVKNRRKKDHRITRYARDIAAGNWKLTGEAIKFDRDGNLVDGQNRLYAVIEANAPAQFLVVRGLDPETMEVLDSGAPRSAADALTLHGYGNGKDVAAVCHSHKMWASGGFIHAMTGTNAGAARMTNAEIIEYADAHPDLVGIAPQARKIATQLRFPSGPVAVVLHETIALAGEQAYSFFDRIAEMQGGGAGDPVSTLLKRATAEANRGGRILPGTAMFLLIRSWNAFITGERLVKFQIGSATGGWAAMPKILGPKDEVF